MGLLMSSSESRCRTPSCVNFLMEAGWPRLGARRSEGSSPSSADHRAASLYSVDWWVSDHDAAMRIGGEAPGGGPNLQHGVKTIGRVGSPPPRIVIGSQPRQRGRASETVFSCSVAAKLQATGCRTTPPGASPVVTKRHSAMSSLRASATIMVLRVPPRASAVRARYHCASALSF